mmetsp:Transcript_10059/g.22045  ORF Transcript_10059/g.22045 Transcript_10059/m.22045 type:complete len:765 (+) Transcript_10059:214-2508(+)
MSASKDDNHDQLSPILRAELLEVVRTRPDFVRRLLDEEEQRVGTPINVPSEPAENPKCSAKRKDLSASYREGHGETPVDQLDKALDAIVEEHQDARQECEHKSFAAAPFLCVLQSTGYGKTRAILRLAETKKKKVVYFLMKNLNGSWQVPQVITSFLNSLRESSADEYLMERKWIKFLNAVKQSVEQGKFDDSKALYNAQVTEEGAFGDFYHGLSKFWEKEETPRKKPIRSALKKEEKSRTPNQQIQASGQGSDSESSRPSKRVKFSYSNSTNITQESLVVCFDEVSALSDGELLALRRAAKYLGILAIFADTATSICKIMRPNDHSSHEKGGTLGRFVAPIFSLNTTDLTWSDDDYDNYENLFCAGRPRWQSHINMCKQNDSNTSDDSIESLISLATTLLTRDVGDDLERNEQDLLRVSNDKVTNHVLPHMIAVFSCRFSLGPRSKISQLLVKHSLATVVGVSEDRSVICSAYPSEPLLAEVSARYTKQEQNLTLVIKHVKAALHSSNKILDPPRGDIGEMCAAALLGYAMDDIRQRKEHTYMSMSVELKELLQLFSYGADNITNNLTSSLINNWNVNFTHFVRPAWTPTQHDLKVMWNRRMAYYVPAGCKGLDLLIAVQHNQSKEYGTLRVQVKNYTNKISNYERQIFFQKLLPSQCPPKLDDESFSVGLLLSVNGIHECCQLLHGPDHTPYQQEESQHPLKNPVLQLATSFPRQAASPLAWLSNELGQICSQNTCQKIDIDWFGDLGIQRKIQNCKQEKSQ